MRVTSSAAAALALASVLMTAACTANVTGSDGSRGDARKDALASERALPAEGIPRDAPPAPDKQRAPDAGDPCKGVTCSGHGQCKSSGGQAACVCDPYYKTGADKLSCIDACIGVSCNTGYACVPGAHNQTNPMCVETCDCSNCGNCALSQIPSMGVAYCGSSSSPPTVVCNKPCSGGQGCIPYTPGICWPMEGCLSK